MRSFFKMFLASFLAMIIFCIAGVFLLVGMASSLATKEKPSVAEKSILSINLSQHFPERMQENPFGVLTNEETDVPGLYDVVRLIKHAKQDKNIAGIFIVANDNANSFASSEEIRNAIADFKTSKKFVLAHGDIMTQQAYYVASTANRLYVNPSGSLDWKGFNIDLVFLKGALDKLKIQPQIFYAGKFKSATEPLRTTKMTPENKLQTAEWLGDLYNYFLIKSSQARGLDTATLHNLANTGAIQNAQDALANKLVDGLKYDDQVKESTREPIEHLTF